jgi:ankyrin repeat protein
MVKLLLDKGADVNARDSDDHDTALTSAVQIGEVAIVRLLLERGANVHLLYPSPWYPSRRYHKPHEKINPPVTALYWAIFESQNEIAKLLIQKRASVKDKYEDGNTLLMMAVRMKEPDLEIIKYLLAKGGNINARNEEGKTALQIAKQNEDEPAIIALLQKAGAKE